MAYTPGTYPDKQHRVAVLSSQLQGQIDGPLPLLSGGSAPFAKFQDFINPSFSRLLAQNVVARTSQSLGQFVAVPAAPVQQLPAGQQVYETPRGAARQQDYTFIGTYFHGLIGQDTFPVGEQLSGNPPSSPQRARDYSFSSSLFLGQIPAGIQLSGNPPAAPLRAREYGHTASYFQGLIGQDQLPVGEQLSGNPPLQQPRSVDYSFNSSAFLGQIPVGYQLSGNPPPAPLRAREYGFTASYFLGLIGQDQLPPGEQLSGNPPAGPLRASTLSEPGINQAIYLTVPPPVIPYGQNTFGTDLPPRAPVRARDYTYVQSFALELIGQDTFFGGQGKAPNYDWPNPSFIALARQAYVANAATNFGQRIGSLPLLLGQDQLPTGEQSFDLPPRSVPRLLDYSWSQTAQQVQPPAVIPPGEQFTDLPPRTASRAVDYTWTQSRFLATTPVGSSSFELPAKAPARAVDYTWIQTFPLELIGQDQFPRGRSTFDLPPKAAQRARDYTHVSRFSMDDLQNFGKPNTTGTTELTKLPTYGPARLPDYSFYDEPFVLFRLAPPPPSIPYGLQIYDLPPRAPSRMQEYSWFSSFGVLTRSRHAGRSHYLPDATSIRSVFSATAVLDNPSARPANPNLVE